MIDSSVSVVTFTYLRPDFLDRQMEQILRLSHPIDDIVVANLDSDFRDEFNYNFDIKFEKDFGLHLKFVAALSCNSEYILILDDDVIPGEKCIHHLFDCMEKKQGIYGGLGFVIRNGYYDHHWSRNTDHNEAKETDACGQAWFLKRNHIKYLFEEPFPVKDLRSGEDLLISMRANRIDGIKTYVPPYPDGEPEKHLIKEMMATGERAHHNREEKHVGQREAVINSELQKGYVPLEER